MLGLPGSILGLRGPSQAQEGPCEARVGPFENKVDEKMNSFHFWEGPIRPGGPSMANFTPVTRALAAPLYDTGLQWICYVTVPHLCSQLVRLTIAMVAVVSTWALGDRFLILPCRECLV